MLNLRTVLLVLIATALVVVVQGCGGAKNNGLKAGINYMQPIKWRMTYRYRVQNIEPLQRSIGKRPSKFDPDVNAVGPGSYEIWFVGPFEDTNIRNVEFISADPPPTKISADPETGLTYYYFDTSQDGMLPEQIQINLTWEFTTFETYAFWDGMPKTPYDKNSELYKKYTKEDGPIKFHPTMVRVAKDCAEDANSDVMMTALNCYNYLIQNFTYDFSQEIFIGCTGQNALQDSYRCWENKFGICDEFATTYCAMLRSAGIPARPVAGMVHLPIFPFGQVKDDKFSEIEMNFKLVEKELGPMIYAGGHAWAEFYMPDVGWIPVDPTWGQYPGVIHYTDSYIGHNRDIPVVDYYYGKIDPYRITFFKGWDLELHPKPKTPDADPIQPWMIGCTERSSGIRNMSYGWDNPAGLPLFGRFVTQTSGYEGVNLLLDIEAIGPVPDEDITDLITKIESEGNHYLPVPKIPGKWNFHTNPTSPEFQDHMREIAETYMKYGRIDPEEYNIENLLNL